MYKYACMYMYTLVYVYVHTTYTMLINTHKYARRQSYKLIYRIQR